MKNGRRIRKDRAPVKRAGRSKRGVKLLKIGLYQLAFPLSVNPLFHLAHRAYSYISPNG